MRATSSGATATKRCGCLLVSLAFVSGFYRLPCVWCFYRLPCVWFYCLVCVSGVSTVSSKLPHTKCGSTVSSPLPHTKCGNSRMPHTCACSMPHTCACAADTECGSGRCANCATALRPEASRYPSSSRHPLLRERGEIFYREIFRLPSSTSDCLRRHSSRCLSRLPFPFHVPPFRGLHLRAYTHMGIKRQLLFLIESFMQ